MFPLLLFLCLEVIVGAEYAVFNYNLPNVLRVITGNYSESLVYAENIDFLATPIAARFNVLENLLQS